MKKVLIIEDDPLCLKLEKTLFEQKGYEVYTAPDSDIGMRIALEEKPNLLIVDYLLPKTSGVELISQIRNDGEIKNVPCVIVSAAATKNDTEKFEKSGANGYILKPFNIKTLVEEIEKLAEDKIHNHLKN